MVGFQSAVGRPANVVVQPVVPGKLLGIIRTFRLVQPENAESAMATTVPGPPVVSTLQSHSNSIQDGTTQCSAVDFVRTPFSL
jgi:hypothetical protein